MMKSIQPIAQAFAEGYVERLLQVYSSTMRALEAEKSEDILLPVIQRLLREMARGATLVEAIHRVNSGLNAMASKRLVLTAAVDIIAHDRKPGDKPTAVPSCETTFKALGLTP